ncbi:MAG: hypothetical protein WA860_01640 [Acidimicrobiales bacterium]
MQSIEPKSVRDLVSDLLASALDPDDPFANEIIHLLIVGSVLQGLVSKRDLEAAPRLDGARFLLDTPLLLDLVDAGTSAAKVMTSLIEKTVNLGAKVVVANHTIEEWERLWAAAETEESWVLDERQVPRHFDRLTESSRTNPFVAQFIRARETAPSLTWENFKRQHSSVARLLEAMHVEVRTNGNDDVEDRRVVDKMVAAFAEITSDGTVFGFRSKAGAEADAQSAAMIARWRRKYEIDTCSAYFVSTEHLTGIAYKRAYPLDELPLTVRPSALLMLAVSLVTDDPDERVRLAEVLSDAAFRESFFGLATAYTLEEALMLSEYLVEDNQLSLEDTRRAVQFDVAAFLSGQDELDANGRMALVGAELVRRRSAMRDARAARAEVNAKRLLEVERAESSFRIDELSAELETLRTVAIPAVESSQDDRDLLRHWQRGFVVLGLAVVAFGTIWGLRSGQVISPGIAKLATILAIAVLADAVRYVLKLSVKWWEPLLAALIAACWVLLGTLMKS